MKKIIRHSEFTRLLFPVLAFLAGSIFPSQSLCQTGVRSELAIPSIMGFITAKCDFHQHTVFSDGLVWPTVRAGEAWREGLDAIALTDHIEYQPHGDDLPTHLNRPYELAREEAQELDILLIKGAEITRDMPPGHLNALFLEDIQPLAVKDYREAVRSAVNQGAFIFWNHPDFPGPEKQFVWNSDVERLRAEGSLHGIEVANGQDYYPASHRWCIDKKLTMIGSSDVHNPIEEDYDLLRGEHRPLTLVFARDRSLPAIREGLFARRTVVYWKNLLIGEEAYLKAIFESSVELLNSDFSLPEKGSVLLQLRNHSDIPFDLLADPSSNAPLKTGNVTLYPRKTSLLRVSRNLEVPSGKKELKLPFVVKNLLVAPEKSLQVNLSVKIKFVP